MNECNEQTHTERKRGREGENGLQRNKKKKQYKMRNWYEGKWLQEGATETSKEFNHSNWVGFSFKNNIISHSQKKAFNLYFNIIQNIIKWKLYLIHKIQLNLIEK